MLQWSRNNEAAMLRPTLALAVLLAAASAGAEQPTIVVPNAGADTTVAKVNGETVVLKKTPTGTVGKMGKDTVILHTDKHGNTVGKVGKDKVFCHTDKASGITLCK
jgi:hypothetical protein